MTAITQGTIGDYSFAVPSSKVNDFSSQHGVTVTSAEELEDAADWSDVDERLNPSVFLIETSYRSTPLRIRDILPEKIRPKRSELEDDSCSWCSGRGAVRCQATGCIGGARPVTELYTVTLNVGNISSQGTVGGVVKEYKCNTCKGRGFVDCPLCKGKGVDPDLR
jgi:hypothetical protein